MTWVVIGVVGAATVLFKAAGPVLLGGREIPPPVADVVEALAPAMLAALVVTQTVGGDRALALDERFAGVAVAVVAIRLRVPLFGVMAVAGATAALIRLL